MSVELERRVADLAARWDAQVAPVTLDDLRARRGATGLGPEPVPFTEAGGDADPVVEASIPAAPFSRPRVRRYGRWVALAAAAAASLVAIVVLVGRDDHDPSGPSNTVASTLDTSTTTVAPTTVVPTTVAPTEVPAAGPPVTVYADGATAEYLAFETARADALATFDTFTARVTLTDSSRESSVDAPAVVTSEISSVITMRGDGSFQAHRADGTRFDSYDPTTGLARSWEVHDDGTSDGQEITVAWPDVAEIIGVGYDPTVLGSFVAPTVDTGTSHLGRAAWVLKFEAGSAPGTADQPEEELTTLVDQATGLVVSSHWVMRSEGGEQIVDKRLDDLEIGVPLPADWPGTFPDGTTVRATQDDLAGLTVSVTVEEAVTQFGVPFAVPRDAEVDAAWISRPPYGPDGTPLIQLVLQVRTGFRRSSITYGRIPPVAGAPTPSGYLEFAGSLCASTDGVRCNGTEADATIDAGAYAGLPVTVGHGLVAGWTSGAVSIAVNAATADDALALVRSLELVTPPG